MCNNIYDRFTDFEVCEFIKKTKSKYTENETFFL